ncbi:MAG: hypothetical protein AB7U82_04460 [Blastocatellales bacterium]
MKRTFLLLSKKVLGLASALAIFCIAVSLTTSHAQQTATDEVSLRLLPVPTNVIGTTARGVSNDGKRIVFDSINDYNGRNVDSNTEIYVYDVDTRSTIMITDTADIKDPADSTKTLFKINNVTPAISGDGTKIVFVSNAEFNGSKNDDRNFEVYVATLPRNSTAVTISRLTDTDKNADGEFVKEIFNNYLPGINDDGSVITFVSTRRGFKAVDGGSQAFTALKEGPANNQTDPDGNGEIFIYNSATKQFSQATASRDIDATSNFVVKGFNSSPLPSGDGRSLVFLSGFNYPGANANKNSDFNGEIFIYKIGDPVNNVTQVTDTTGTAIVPVLNFDGSYSVNPSAPMNVLNSATHPISGNGSLLTFESAGNFTNNNADKTRELWLYNVNTKAYTQLTNQSASATPTQDELKKIDYNFQPSVNATGTHISFGSTLNLTPAATSGVKADNADGSREVFRYDIAAQKFRQVTFADKSGLVLDQRDAVVQPFTDNSGAAITFSFLAPLLAPRAAVIEDLFQAVIRPVTAKSPVEAKLANAASFDATQAARGSIVAGFGAQLANATVGAPSANLPFDLGGVTVTVNGLAARLIFVSPGQVNFVLPLAVANGDSADFTINNNGVQSAGKVKIVDASPGVFTTTSDGKGATAAQCGRVSADGLGFLATLPPCLVGNESQADLLIIYGTGWRNGSGVQVKIGDQTLTPSFAGPQPEFLGLDQINVNLTKELADKKDQDVTVIIPAATNIESNKSKTSFLPLQASITVQNGASMEAGAVARGSVAVAQGTKLSDETATAPGPDYPTELKGVKVNVADMPARISYVSPTQVNFILPNNIAPADLVEVVINNNGVISRGRVKVQHTAPGVFTTTGDGNGRALAKCGKVNTDGSITLSDPPCSVGTEANPNIIRIFGTGWRNADKVTLKIGDVELTNVFAGGQPAGGGATTPGIDIIDAKLTPALAGKTDVDVIVTATSADKTFTSKVGIKVSFTSN